MNTHKLGCPLIDEYNPHNLECTCHNKDMNNLQQFLEEEFKDYGVRMSEDEDHFEFESPSPSKILDFTNKVLDEVKREVEKKAGEGTLVSINDISTIINNLRVK